MLGNWHSSTDLQFNGLRDAATLAQGAALLSRAGHGEGQRRWTLIAIVSVNFKNECKLNRLIDTDP